jgi:extradiol dioxygenase family protein
MKDIFLLPGGLQRNQLFYGMRQTKEDGWSTESVHYFILYGHQQMNTINEHHQQTNTINKRTPSTNEHHQQTNTINKRAHHEYRQPLAL